MGSTSSPNSPAPPELRVSCWVVPPPSTLYSPRCRAASHPFQSGAVMLCRWLGRLAAANVICSTPPLLPTFRAVKPSPKPAPTTTRPDISGSGVQPGGQDSASKATMAALGTNKSSFCCFNRYSLKPTITVATGTSNPATRPMIRSHVIGLGLRADVIGVGLVPCIHIPALARSYVCINGPMRLPGMVVGR